MPRSKTHHLEPSRATLSARMAPPRGSRVRCFSRYHLDNEVDHARIHRPQRTNGFTNWLSTYDVKYIWRQLLAVHSIPIPLLAPSNRFQPKPSRRHPWWTRTSV